MRSPPESPFGRAGLRSQRSDGLGPSASLTLFALLFPAALIIAAIATGDPVLAGGGNLHSSEIARAERGLPTGIRLAEASTSQANTSQAEKHAAGSSRSGSSKAGSSQTGTGQPGREPSSGTLAQGAGAAISAPAAARNGTTGLAPATSVVPFVVEGFRSARFGMSEQAVREAIAKDFGASATIRAEDNAVEQTRILIVAVPDLLPNSGKADVAYVLGYKSKALIQVSLLWSKATDPAITPERLFTSATILRTHFMSEGYKPGSIASNLVTEGGIVLFRGLDEAEHTTILLLQGPLSTDQERKVLTPSALLVFYISDAKNPDVFRLKRGQF